ncbi:pheromone-regulated protein prm10 [Coemansia sp. RSA 2702]|nr:pheromone-regulated protein prm10 [Coemansia sp. RSA 2702]
MQIPLGDTDLTRFLPYALSTPGIQSVLGSPSLSRESSTNDMADWLRRKGHLLSAAAAPPIDGSDNTNDQDPDALRDQRLHVLEGIHRLLLHQRFICLLAQAMMQFGAPLHHLEDNLSRISRHLRIAATFTTTPGLVMISIEDTATFTSETKIIRCASGYDMHRLDLTDRVVRMVSKDNASVEDGTRRLTEIMSMPPLFAWYWQLIDWGLASWSVCLLAFNGSWIDSLAAFVLGLVVGCLNLLASRLKGYTNLFEASVSILSGFMASVFSRWVCFAAVTLSATVVLLPGLILTTGAIELASRNMHAGTIRVGYALMLAFIIAFGINLGSNIYIELFSTPGRASDMNLAMCSPVSQWWWWLAFPVAILSICLLINVHPRNWPVCMLVAGAMFAVFWTLVIHLQLQVIGPVVSAFVLGLVGNIWGKLSHHNAYAIMLPGMMVLVPGSVGVRGFVTMFSGSEAGASTQLVSQMVQTSLSIMVVRCAGDSCGHFQSQQEKKANKWTCVVCGLKQSLKRVYFQSTAPKKCRAAVMDLNMNRGQAQAAKKQHIALASKDCMLPASSYTPSAALQNEQHSDLPTTSKWDGYADDEAANEPAADETEFGTDKHNRIVVGRVEKDKPAARRPAKRAEPQKTRTNHSAATACTPTAQTSGKSAFAQAIASIAQQRRPAQQQQQQKQQASQPPNPRRALSKPSPAPLGASEPQDPSRWDCYASDEDDASASD